MGISSGTSQHIAQASLPSEPPNQAALGPVSFGKPSIMKPSSYSASLFSKSSSGAFANHSQSNLTVFAPAPHLEAHILRPMVPITDASAPRSYETDSLKIDEEAMQAYMYKIDPNRIVMELLVDLTPQESRLVQLRAKQRNGNIVSIQHGKPIDMVEHIGVPQAKPIIFIIKTTSVLGQEDENPAFLVPFQ